MIFYRGTDIAFDRLNSSQEERKEFARASARSNKLVTQAIFLQNLPRVGDYACYCAINLVVVKIPEGIESIGYAAFYS